MNIQQQGQGFKKKKTGNDLNIFLNIYPQQMQ